MFTAILVVALWKFEVVLDVLKAIWGILFPFVLGGAIAFVTNVPMSFLENKIFGKVKKENKIVVKLAKEKFEINIWLCRKLSLKRLIDRKVAAFICGSVTVPLTSE